MLLKHIVNFLKRYKIFLAWSTFENIFLLFLTTFYILSFIFMVYYEFFILYNITFLPEIIKVLETKKNILINNHVSITCTLGRYLFVFNQIKLTGLNSLNKEYIMFSLFSNFVSLNKSNGKEFSVYLELLEQFIKKTNIYLSNEDVIKIKEELENINNLKHQLELNNEVFLLNDNNINDTKDRLQQLLELTDKLSIINISI